jgi:hypothetical protein
LINPLNLKNQKKKITENIKPRGKKTNQTDLKIIKLTLSSSIPILETETR